MFRPLATSGRSVRFRFLLLMVVVGGMAVFTSCKCAPPDDGETRTPPVHRTWWNYYERGVKASTDGAWDEARRDFEVCLGVRSGAKYSYPCERWQARTYGVRFINDYFPHRELGIALLKLGRAGMAVRELEESLRQEPSGRAKYYLNEAVRVLQDSQVLAAPVITLDDTSENPVYSRDHVFRVTGRVSAEGHVNRIEVGGVLDFIELAELTRTFSREVPLCAGTNMIRILASDLNGRTSEKVIQRVADWRRPSFCVRKMAEREGLLVVDCNVYDDFEVSRVDVRNIRHAAMQTRLGADAVRLSLAISPGEHPVVEVADEAGNLLKVDVLDTISSTPKSYGEHYSEAIGFPFTFRCAPVWLFSDSLGARPFVLSALFASAGVLQDTVKPTLRLGSGNDRVRVFVPEFYVEGEAGDPGGLASVTVNGQEYLRPSDKGSVCFTFGGRLPLDTGSNLFAVVAVDMAGNRQERKFTVVCSEPEYQDAEYRLAAGIPPFCPQGNNWAGQARARLQNEFTRLPLRFRLLERDEGWEHILRELSLSASDLADPKAALRVGRIISAELLFVGVVLNQGNGMTVQVRAVDSTEGRILLTSDVYAEKPERDLPYQMGGLFLKIIQNFPVAEGKIFDLTDNAVRLDIGSDQGVHAGSKFIVVRGGTTGNESTGGDVLCVTNRPVSLEVERSSKNTCCVRVLPPEAAKLLQKGDRVYAR